MTSQKFYTPILRCKEGEILALGDINREVPAIAESLFPLLNITTTCGALQAKAEDTDKFVKAFSRHWENRPLYVCAHWKADYDTNNYLASLLPVVAELSSQFEMAIPAINLDALVIDKAKSLTILNTFKQTEVCIYTNVDSLSELSELVDVIGPMRLEQHFDRLHLLVDVGRIDQGDVPSENHEILPLAVALEGLSQLLQWERCTIAAGSLPAIFKAGTSHFDRLEKQAYFNLDAADLGWEYGDHSVVSPDWVDVKPGSTGGFQPPVTYRHTGEAQIAIVKSQIAERQDKTSRSVAFLMTLLPIFSGANYSCGARWISECANGKGGTGNAGSWIRHGHSHHFCRAVKDDGVI